MTPYNVLDKTADEGVEACLAVAGGPLTIQWAGMGSLASAGRA